MANQKNKFDKLTETIYPIVERNLRERGHNPGLADVITMQLAYESNYGTEPTGKFNLGGIKHSGERMKDYEFVVGSKDIESYTSFKNYDDLIKFYLHNTEQKWGDALTAMSSDEYIDKIHQADKGGYSYSGTSTDRYKATMNGMKSMQKSIDKFKTAFDPSEYKDYIGDVELGRTGASAKITDDSIQRLDSYVDRGTPSKQKESTQQPVPSDLRMPEQELIASQQNIPSQEQTPVINPEYQIPEQQGTESQVNVDELNFNYQPKESQQTTPLFSKGKVTLPEMKPSEAMAEQDDKLGKEREQRFQFTGVPTISASTGLVGNKFEEGGALTEFNSGGEHGENPLGGIRQGINEEGTYNLVEEGETKYNDYIFSDKFFLSEDDLLRARLDPKLEGKSVAEASKYLNRFLDDAPFDKITRDTVNEQLDNLILLNEKFKEDSEFINNTFKVSENPEELMPEGENLQGDLPVDMEGQAVFAYGGDINLQSSGLDDAIANGRFNSPTNTVGAGTTAVSSAGSTAGGIASGVTGLYDTLSESMDTSAIDTDGEGFTDPNSISQGKMAGQGALKGAAAGAAIGSVVPVIGTVIGAVGGAIIGGVGGLVGGNQKKKKAQRSKVNYEYKQMNKDIANEGIIFKEGGDLKDKKRLGYKSPEYSIKGVTPTDVDAVLQSFYAKNANPGAGGNLDNNPIARQVETYIPATPQGRTMGTITNATIPANFQYNPQEATQANAGFVPRSNNMADALGYAPIAGSLLNVLDKQTPEQVSFRTNDFKYTPDYVDENLILNPVRQSSANTLRSLEQSGMSPGQLAAAKLAVGANEARGVSEAMNQINALNRAEDRTAKEFEYRTTAENVGIYNRETEANEANRAMADLQNRQARNELFQNLGELGTDTRNVNTAFNMSRGYDQSGTFNPESDNYAKRVARYLEGLTTKEEGGSLFADNEQTQLIKALLKHK